MANKDYEPLLFKGTTQEGNVPIYDKDGNEESLDNYIPDPDLVNAVNMALLLEKPLLVMGEPGCGKSLLAKAIAYDLYKKNLISYYREWHIKSTTKAREGLYQFDYVQRLRDATLQDPDSKVDKVDKYIHLGELGEAFMLSTAPDKRAVLLIDEIDKADLDFPNDLLNELDRMEFEIAEKRMEEQSSGSNATTTGLPSRIKAAYRPVVIITSNSEKDLPDAFLRRCIFHYIAPLSEEKLRKIVIGRYYSDPATEDPLIAKAINLFVKLRSTIRDEVLSIGKNVSTSEFVNWFEALKYYDQLRKDQGNAPEPQNEGLLRELDKLEAVSLDKIPFRNILLKNLNSLIRFSDK